MSPITAEQHQASVANTSPPLPTASTTHHHPRKKFFNRLQALITSPKRSIGHLHDTGHHVRTRSHSGSSTHSEKHGRHGAAAAGRDRSSSNGSSLSANSRHSRLDPNSSSGTTAATSPTMDSDPRSPASSTMATSPLSSQGNSHSEKQDILDAEAIAMQDNPVSIARDGAIASQEAPLQKMLQGPQPEVLTRPHLKLRLVTWNMHDSLPTGDLTELLGAPTTASSVLAEQAIPLDPSHPIPPLQSGLTKDPPYHLIVVGGQEVPVGYGGWSGPNWTEIIQGWLSGTSLGAKEAAKSGVGSESFEDIATPSVVERADREILSPIALAKTKSDSMADLDRGPLSPGIGAATKRSSTPAFLFPPPTSHQQSATGYSGQPMERSPSALSSRTTDSALSANDSHASISTSSNSSTATTTGTAPGLSGGAQHASSQPNPAVATQAAPPEADSPYVLITKERLMGIYCSVWAHRSILPLVHGSSTGTVTAGLLAGKLGNKGAACISLWIADTRLLFVCAHLAAHSEKMMVRQQNVKKIKEELVIETFREAQKAAKEEANSNTAAKSGNMEEDSHSVISPVSPATATFPAKKKEPLSKEAKEMKHEEEAMAKEKEKELAKENRDKNRERLIEERNKRKEDGKEDITDCFDYTFWFGDLNFRLDISRLHADFLIKEKQYSTAFTFDQLTPILKEKDGCFRGFAEPPINFAPTFKYDVLKLKRSKTLQRSGTAMSITSASEYRRSIKRISAPASALGSLNSPSRSTLPNEGLTEEEEDEDDEEDRHTLASSRASISSAFSGFETILDDDGNPIDRPLGHTPGGGGYFGAGGGYSPNTPTAEKLVEKAKGFFNHFKPKHNHASHSFQSQSSSHTGGPPSLRPATAPNPLLSPQNVLAEPSSTQPIDLTPPAQPHQEGFLSPNISSANASALSLSESAPPNQTGIEQHHQQQQKLAETTGLTVIAPGRKSLSIDPLYGNQQLRPATPVSINVSPATSPRPRLHSARSSATIFSFASGAAALAPAKQLTQEEREKQLEDDAVFDTSSKKRVQSWTDRILYKSTIKRVDEQKEESLGRHGVGSTIIDSLKGVKRTLTGHGLISAGSGGLLSSPGPVPLLQQRRTGQKVSFQQQQESSSLPHTASAPPIYARKNTSSSSLHSQVPGSQQRMNNRFAKLFHRHSSNNANSPTVASHSPDLPTTSENGLAPASRRGFLTAQGDSQPCQPPRLLRSMSLQHRLQRRNSAKRPGSAGGVSSIGENAESISPGKPRPRSKPSRSNTSPDTSSVHSADGTGHPPKLSILPLANFAKDENASPPLVTGGTGASAATSATIMPTTTRQGSDLLTPTSAGPSGRPRAMSDASTSPSSPNLPSDPVQPPSGSTPAVASSAMSRPGSAPHPMYVSSDIQAGATVDSVPLDDSKRAFSFSNPFAGFHPTSSSSNGPSAASAPHAAIVNERSVKSTSQHTGLGLPQSKTTPIPASTSPNADVLAPAATTTSPSALRQWWNTHHLFLPSFLSHNGGDSSNGESALLLSPDAIETQNAEGTPLPPAPIVIGPERGEVMCITYDAVADLRRMQACSDHRPVVAVYALGL